MSVVWIVSSRLNRYWDARDTPRDESWREDRETAAKAAPRAPAIVVAQSLGPRGDPAFVHP
jgi:neutral trehalase